MSSLVTAMEKKTRGPGRPKKVGGEEYTTVKIKIGAYQTAKALAGLNSKTVADVVSELVAEHGGITLEAQVKKRAPKAN